MNRSYADRKRYRNDELVMNGYNQVSLYEENPVRYDGYYSTNPRGNMPPKRPWTRNNGEYDEFVSTSAIGPPGSDASYPNNPPYFRNSGEINPYNWRRAHYDEPVGHSYSNSWLPDAIPNLKVPRSGYTSMPVQPKVSLRGDASYADDPYGRPPPPPPRPSLLYPKPPEYINSSLGISAIPNFVHNSMGREANFSGDYFAASAPYGRLSRMLPTYPTSITPYISHDFTNPYELSGSFPNRPAPLQRFSSVSSSSKITPSMGWHRGSALGSNSLAVDSLLTFGDRKLLAKQFALNRHNKTKRSLGSSTRDVPSHPNNRLSVYSNAVTPKSRLTTKLKESQGDKKVLIAEIKDEPTLPVEEEEISIDEDKPKEITDSAVSEAVNLRITLLEYTISFQLLQINLEPYLGERKSVEDILKAKYEMEKIRVKKEWEESMALQQEHERNESEKRYEQEEKEREEAKLREEEEQRQQEFEQSQLSVAGSHTQIEKKEEDAADDYHDKEGRNLEQGEVLTPADTAPMEESLHTADFGNHIKCVSDRSSRPTNNPNLHRNDHPIRNKIPHHHPNHSSNPYHSQGVIASRKAQKSETKNIFSNSHRSGPRAPQASRPLEFQPSSTIQPTRSFVRKANVQGIYNNSTVGYPHEQGYYAGYGNDNSYGSGPSNYMSQYNPQGYDLSMNSRPPGGYGGCGIYNDPVLPLAPPPYLQAPIRRYRSRSPPPHIPPPPPHIPPPPRIAPPLENSGTTNAALTGYSHYTPYRHTQDSQSNCDAYGRPPPPPSGRRSEDHFHRSNGWNNNGNRNTGLSGKKY